MLVPRKGRFGLVDYEKALYHPAGVHASLRNAIMGAKSNDEWYNIMAWVYDGPSTDVRLRS
jgi:hypothetical protein